MFMILLYFLKLRFASTCCSLSPSMKKNKTYALRLLITAIIISSSVFFQVSCSKKNENSTGSSQGNSPSPDSSKTSPNDSLSTLSNDSFLQLKVQSSVKFNDFLRTIQADTSSSIMKYFLQDGAVYTLEDSKLDQTRQACSITLYKRKMTVDGALFHLKYISENSNKLIAINMEVNFGITCITVSGSASHITIESLNQIFNTIAVFSIEKIPPHAPNTDLKSECGDNNYFITLDHLIQDCNESKVTLNGSTWKLVSRTKSGLETWLSPSGMLWSANLGKNSLVEELNDSSSMCKNYAANTWGLVNLKQSEKPIAFTLPDLDDYKKAKEEGINEIVQDNINKDYILGQHIYWIKPAGFNYYVYKFFRNSIEEYQWVDKPWFIRCIGKKTDGNAANTNQTEDPRKIAISYLPTKQVVFNTMLEMNLDDLSRKDVFQNGARIKEKNIDKTKVYCRMNTSIPLLKDFKFSVFINRESNSPSVSKIELSSFTNRVSVVCIKPDSKKFTVSDLDEVFLNYFSISIPYTSGN